MTVITSPVKVMDRIPLVKAARRRKLNAEIRPLTATLEYPAILDITFLKKLDMTSFTKKGLIAISKICGISLVRTQGGKVHKCFKRPLQEREREPRETRKRSLNAESGDDQSMANCLKPKWTRPKGIPKIKVSDSSIARSKTEVTKDFSPVSGGKPISPRPKSKLSKPSVNDILFGALETEVTEPCETCGRSEQPERFHSHPKKTFRGKQVQQKNAVQKLSNSDRSNVVVTNRKRLDSEANITTEKNILRRYSTGHLQSECASKLCVDDVEPSFHSDHEIESIKMSAPKASNAFQSGRANKNIFCKKIVGSNSSPDKSVNDAGKKSNFIACNRCSGEFASTKIKTHEVRCRQSSVEKKVPPPGNLLAYEDRQEQDLKYVTGCYVCAKQMGSEVRIAHEKDCIAEWRRQNRQLPADERKAEPLRPDFRFTATGGVDYEATYNSIWSNHLDSLVPCGKCGRTFFPERIEKHEACCSTQHLKVKHHAPRNK